jgi:formylmethanofuran dehydrogenase subunit A
MVAGGTFLGGKSRALHVVVGFTLATDSCLALVGLVPIQIRNKGCVHTVAFAIYIKMYLNAKEELWKLIYFTTIPK